MSDTLPYFVGTINDMKACGIDTDGLRQSLTGERIETIVEDEAIISDTHKVIVHQSVLTPEQIRAIRFNEGIAWYFGDEAVQLMGSVEWSDVNES